MGREERLDFQELKKDECWGYTFYLPKDLEIHANGVGAWWDSWCNISIYKKNDLSKPRIVIRIVNDKIVNVFHTPNYKVVIDEIDKKILIQKKMAL